MRFRTVQKRQILARAKRKLGVTIHFFLPRQLRNDHSKGFKIHDSNTILSNLYFALRGSDMHNWQNYLSSFLQVYFSKEKVYALECEMWKMIRIWDRKLKSLPQNPRVKNHCTNSNKTTVLSVGSFHLCSPFYFKCQLFKVITLRIIPKGSKFSKAFIHST